MKLKGMWYPVNTYPRNEIYRWECSECGELSNTQEGTCPRCESHLDKWHSWKGEMEQRRLPNFLNMRPGRRNDLKELVKTT